MSTGNVSIFGDTIIKPGENIIRLLAHYQIGAITRLRSGQKTFIPVRNYLYTNEALAKRACRSLRKTIRQDSDIEDYKIIRIVNEILPF